MSQPSILKDFVTVSAVGDGNCLFRALSFALYGTQDMHEYLRLVTAIEMITNPQWYDKTSCHFSSPFASVVEVSQFRDLLKDVVTDGASCEIMHLLAASAAVRMPLMSYCPPGAAYCSPFG
jgi:hypothetical protein